MKNILLLLSSVFVWFACQNDGAEGVKEIRDTGGPVSEMVRNPVSADLPTDTNQLARIKFEEEIFNFEEVDEGDVVKHEFKFKNTGKVPLTILRAESSCGCTIPEWPKDPIPPGGTGSILAKFNTEGKALLQRKTISVTANTYPNITKVILEGNVKPKN